MHAYQYEMMELSIPGTGDMEALFTKEGETVTVRGFRASENTVKIRFLPLSEGVYTYEIRGAAFDSGVLEVLPAREEHHGPVRAVGTHLEYTDGMLCRTYGTTVYALMHQPDSLIDETLETLKNTPFNKIRLCVFPKHFLYNENEPELFAFERREDGTWDTSRPCFAFWDRFDRRLCQMFDMGFQVDLILFYPYDCWGFSSMSREDDLRYLDYVLCRFAAYPNIWWSLANEYDVMSAKTMEDWYVIEEFVAEHDPFRHLIGNHHCISPWPHERPCTTHVSLQTGQLYRIPEWLEKYRKPVLIDECGYEGNLGELWGSLSGKELTARFWRTMALGGYCTHGETFLNEKDPEKIVFWSKGGKLRGESVARIAFLREIMDGLPGPLEPEKAGFCAVRGKSPEEMEKLLASVPQGMRVYYERVLAMEPVERERFLDGQVQYRGRCGDEVFLVYCDIQTFGQLQFDLPDRERYTVEVIDTWNMTREVQMRNVHRQVTVKLPERPWMAVLTRKNH